MATRKKVTPKAKPSVEQILEQRQKTHGNFSEHACLSMRLKDACRYHTPSSQHAPAYDKLHPAHQEALDMILHKVARVLNGDPNERDHWDDIAGYATLAAKECKE